jgi:hypothetical protein
MDLVDAEDEAFRLTFGISDSDEPDMDVWTETLETFMDGFLRCYPVLTDRVCNLYIVIAG